MTAYEDDHRRTPVPWAGLLLRLFVVVVPGQLIGIVVTGALITLSAPTNGQIGDLILVGAGLLAGLAVGMLVTPLPGRLVTYLVTGAVFGAATTAALLIVSQLSRPTGTPGMTLASAATGPLIVVAVQTLVTWALWRLRHRP